MLLLLLCHRLCFEVVGVIVGCDPRVDFEFVVENQHTGKNHWCWFPTRYNHQINYPQQHLVAVEIKHDRRYRCYRSSRTSTRCLLDLQCALLDLLFDLRVLFFYAISLVEAHNIDPDVICTLDILLVTRYIEQILVWLVKCGWLKPVNLILCKLQSSSASSSYLLIVWQIS